ncbi:hypothetical protein BDV95DRAFT_600481 [Massariosphaeria phaeospora]|uniref:Uncharacterized protein n=1 Tax=Massariosphaeria phaeospora TaxID=100035 RepID=A0A7C8MIM7_9PLEO|nr:hypothetical protein BDV95DRAFT_600481 [Massariosphaeria phaeospora]
MPTWLVHGFRWPRYPIRIHVIQHNLDDAAPDYVMVPATIDALTQNFKQLYPDIMANLASLQFIEQYDPEEHTISQPYAYVCDQVHEVRLGVDIDEIRGQGVTTDAWSALVDLRDKLAPGNKVGWFVVVNGDVERFAPPIEEPVDSKTPDGFSPTSARSSLGRIEDEEDNCDQAKRQSGLKKWFGGKARKMKR